MSAEQNIAIVRRYYEECTNDYGDPEKKRALVAVDELLTRDFVMYYNNESDADGRRGMDAHKEFLVAHTHAFPGERWTVEPIVADSPIPFAPRGLSGLGVSVLVTTRSGMSAAVGRV